MNPVHIVVAVFIIYAVLIVIYERRYKKMQTYYTDIVAAIATAIDTRDPSTLGHTERVTELSIKVANELASTGFLRADRKFKHSLYIAALLHDIGKIGISVKILGKPGPPTDQEWIELKKHPTISARILEPLSDLKDVIKAVRHHQEHYDGKGYPEQLKAEDIPLMSRIIMVVDAYDAMTSDRPYRSRMSREKAIEEIKNFSGTQFDPKVVEAFLCAVETKQQDEPSP